MQSNLADCLPHLSPRGRRRNRWLLRILDVAPSRPVAASAVVPGILALCAFAWLLTLVEAEHAGRTYAAYGGIYILSALGWLWIA